MPSLQLVDENSLESIQTVTIYAGPQNNSLEPLTQEYEELEYIPQFISNGSYGKGKQTGIGVRINNSLEDQTTEPPEIEEVLKTILGENYKEIEDELRQSLL